MRTYRLVLSAIAVLLLGVVAGQAQDNATPSPTWSFAIDEPSLAAVPGGTTQWTWTIVNTSPIGGPDLHVNDGNATWLPSFFANVEYMDGFGKDFVSPGTLGPGASATGDFFHIDWKPTAPFGTQVSGWALVDILDDGWDPPEGIQQPIKATVTPEPCTIVLLAAAGVPIGMWRLRRRKA